MTAAVKFFIVLYAFVNIVNCFVPKDVIITNKTVLTKFESAAEQFDALFYSRKRLITKSFNNLKNSPSALKISSICLNSLNLTIKSLDEQQQWAYQYLEASAAGTNHFSFGEVANLGSLVKCLGIDVRNISAPDDNRKSMAQQFRGRYCQVTLQFPHLSNMLLSETKMNALKLNTSGSAIESTFYNYVADRIEHFSYDGYTFGLCLPSTCTRADISLIVTEGKVNQNND